MIEWGFFQNFTVCLTELLVDLKTAIEERSEEVLLQFDYVLGRFKHVFLAVGFNNPSYKIDTINFTYVSESRAYVEVY